MTISSSLNAGVAGLQANATRLASISDNIANSSTYGYRRVETDFESVVASSGGARYAAGGVRTQSHRLIDQGGTIVTTPNATDLAVRGQGFLPVTPASSIGSGTPDMLLTTTGSFRTDSDGYLRTNAGMVLMGWPAQSDGSIPNFPRDTQNGLEPVRINSNSFTGEPTTSMTLGVNLPATSTEAGAAGDTQPLSVEYFNNLGSPENVNITFSPTVPATGSSNEWTMTITDSATVPAATVIGEYVLTFSDSRTAGGTLDAVSTTSGGAYDPATGGLIVNVAGGPIEINIGQLGENEGLTQLSDTFAPLKISKDGAPVGNMTGVEVDANGFVVANFDTGISRTIYQIPMVDLPNPNGMVSLDNQTYRTSPDSGPFFLWDAGSGPTGDILSFALEESATDVAGELTSMIRTQRSYSSNAKVIQTVELSLAVPMSLPVEIFAWVLPRSILMDFKVCSATIAPLLVRMLDILVFLQS